MATKAQKTLARFGPGFKNAGKPCCDRGNALFLDTAQQHAVMFCLHHNGGTARAQMHLNGIYNLGGQFFLGLQAAGKRRHHTRQLRQANHSAIRKIADAGRAYKGQHMMLAQRKKRDCAHQDKVAIAACILKDTAQILRRILTVAAQQFPICGGNPARCFGKAFTVRILTNIFQQCRNRLFGMVRTDNRRGFITCTG